MQMVEKPMRKGDQLLIEYGAPCWNWGVGMESGGNGVNCNVVLHSK